MMAKRDRFTDTETRFAEMRVPLIRLAEHSIPGHFCDQPQPDVKSERENRIPKAIYGVFSHNEPSLVAKSAAGLMQERYVIRSVMKNVQQ